MRRGRVNLGSFFGGRGSQGSEPSAPPPPLQAGAEAPPSAAQIICQLSGLCCGAPCQGGEGGAWKRGYGMGAWGGGGTEHGLGAKGKGQKMHLGTRDGDGGDVGTLMG